MNSESISLISAFRTSGRLLRPLVLSQLSFNILMAAFLGPLFALSLRAAVALSGQPALADFDIAWFLLSPVGFVALLAVASLALTLGVLNLGFMMSIALNARMWGTLRFLDGVGTILPKLGRIVAFAALLLLRVLAISLPFLLVAGLIYLRWLTEFDINYYLSMRPTSFVVAVAAIGILLAVMAVILLWAFSGWAMALPLVLFSRVRARDSFVASRALMQGRRLRLMLLLLVWAIASSVIVALPFAAMGALSDRAADWAGTDLSLLVQVLLVCSAIWAVINLVVTAWTSGALAVLVMQTADWPGSTEAAARPAPVWLAPVLIAATLVAAGVAVAGALAADASGPADRVEVIAHRGAAGARPENTIASIEKAIEDGADWVEIDVQETADGEVVVIHDSDLMKIAGANLKVWDATMEDLAEIDIGSWYGSDYADQRVPTLRAVLDAARDRAGVLIELKYYGHDDSLESRVADIVAAAGMEEQVMVMSLKLPGLQKMQALRPDWPAGLLASASLGRVWDLDIDFLAANQGAASPLLVRKLRERGKPLYVWTVDDPLSMSAMVSLGATGLITNEPAMARSVLAQRRELSRVERLVLVLADRLGVDLERKSYRDDSP